MLRMTASATCSSLSQSAAPKSGLRSAMTATVTSRPPLPGGTAGSDVG